MRISDWSSDVCSSDLRRPCADAVQRVDHARRPLLPGLFQGAEADRAGGGGRLSNNSPAAYLSALSIAASICLRPSRKSNRLPPICRHSTAERSAASSSRSEEHTSELQSLMRISYAVFCLKKKKQT